MTVVVHRPLGRRLPAPDPLFAEARQRQRTRRRRLALATLCAGLGGGLATGIGTHAMQSGRSLSTALPRACGLLSNAEVTNALGTPVAFQVRLDDRRYAMCTWSTDSLSKPGFPEVRRTLSVQVSRTTKTAVLQTETMRGSERIPGLGEIAFAQPGGRALVNVYAHGYAIEVTTSFVSSPLSVEKHTARAVLEAL